jgi:hypothetical protein
MLSSEQRCRLTVAEGAYPSGLRVEVDRCEGHGGGGGRPGRRGWGAKGDGEGRSCRSHVVGATLSYPRAVRSTPAFSARGVAVSMVGGAKLEGEFEERCLASSTQAGRAAMPERPALDLQPA